MLNAIRETYVAKNTSVKSWVLAPNASLIVLFSILWLTDCFLTVWAVNNGYIEVWNAWTRMITQNAYAFVLVKVASLGIVLFTVQKANSLFPYVVFIAMVLFNMLIGTVLVANVITVLNT